MEKYGLSTAREIVLLPIATIIEWQDGDGFVLGWEIKAIARPDVEDQSQIPLKGAVNLLSFPTGPLLPISSVNL